MFKCTLERLLTDLGTGSDGLHGPAVQRDKLQSGGQDSSLQLLLCLIVFILLFAFFFRRIKQKEGSVRLARLNQEKGTDILHRATNFSELFPVD